MLCAYDCRLLHSSCCYSAVCYIIMNLNLDSFSFLLLRYLITVQYGISMVRYGIYCLISCRMVLIPYRMVLYCIVFNNTYNVRCQCTIRRMYQKKKYPRFELTFKSGTLIPYTDGKINVSTICCSGSYSTVQYRTVSIH